MMGKISGKFFLAAVFGGVAAFLPQTVSAFDVLWEGRPLAIHPARVSAFPLNQVWSGYQRPVEQSKLAAFVSFDMSAPGELAVTPNEAEDLGEPVLLPLGSAPKTRREGKTLFVAVDRPRQFTLSFGTAGKVLHVFANPPFKAPEGGNVRRFGPGEHFVGVLSPRSGETVVIEEGAVVHGAIQVMHAKDVRIVGRGIVDGSFMDRASHDTDAWRAAVAAGLPGGFYGAEMAVTCFTCAWSTNVTVEGVTFRDPPRWTMIVRAQSKNVAIDNVKIVGCWRYNADGINVCASEDVSIRNSFVRSFDDCIIARGSYLECGGPLTRNVVAEDNVLWCDWGKCLEVWAGHRPCLIENVRFRRNACIAVDAIACDVTTWFASPDTRIKDVAFEDIEVDFAYPRLRQHYQKSREDSEFKAVPKEAQMLFVVDCASYGRYLGNQHYEPATDLSGFRVRYEDIAFRRFRFLGDVPELKAKVDASTSPHTIEGFVMEDMPSEIDVKMTGVSK